MSTHCTSFESSYNWYDLDVGNMHLEHSENFFAKRHSKHERATSPTNTNKFEKKQLHTSADDLAQQLENFRLQQEQRLYNAQLHSEGIVKQAEVASQKLSKALKNSAAFYMDIMKKAKGPNVYRFKDIYEQNKQRLQLQSVENERKNREFRSRPMPNFEQVHKLQAAAKPKMHRMTCPITPNVLKTSRLAEQKRRQKIEELQRERELEELNMHKLCPKPKPVPKFENGPKPPLRKQLYPPQTKPKPFRFSTVERAERRKQFNQQAQLSLVKKRKQEEQLRKQRAEEEQKKNRKMTIFHASPNPFKNEAVVSPRSKLN